MEFFVVFFVCFVVLLGVALAFVFGKPPTYRPARRDILQLFVDVMEKKDALSRWDMFLSIPITHDAELEQIRLSCLSIVNGIDDFTSKGIDGAILNKEGRVQLRVIAARLNKLIEAEPDSRLF